MPTKKYLHDIDLDQNQLVNPVLHKSATAPTTPVDGQLYYNTTAKKVYYYNATTSSWTEVGSNIYNIDGTLTGARVVTMGANNLTFQQGVYGSAGQFIVKGTTTDSSVVGLKLYPSNVNGYYEMYTADGTGRIFTWKKDASEVYIGAGSVYMGNNPNAIQLIVGSKAQFAGSIDLSDYLAFLGSTANKRYIFANSLTLTTNNSLGYGSDQSIFSFTTAAPTINSGSYTTTLVNLLMPVNTGTQGANSRALLIDFSVTTNAGALTAIQTVQGNNLFNSTSGSTYIGYSAVPSGSYKFGVKGNTIIPAIDPTVINQPSYTIRFEGTGDPLATQYGTIGFEGYGINGGSLALRSNSHIAFVPSSGAIYLVGAANGPTLFMSTTSWEFAAYNNSGFSFHNKNAMTSGNLFRIVDGYVLQYYIEATTGDIFQNYTKRNTYIGHTSAPTSAGKLDVNGTIKSRLSSAGNFIEGNYSGTTTFQIGQGGYGTFNGGLTSPKIVFFDQAQIGYSSDGYTLATSINQASTKTLTFLGDLRFAYQSAVNSVFYFSAQYGANGTYDPSNIITIATPNGNAIGRISGGGQSPNNILNIIPTYNFTGTATGTIRGIYYNPTLTSMVGQSHIGFQNVSGDNLFNSTSGSTYIGYSSTPSEGYKLQVIGANKVVFIKGSGSGDYLLVQDSSATPQPLFRISSDGSMTVPTANDITHRIGNLLFKNSTISAYAPITIGSGVDATDPVYFGTKNIYFTTTTGGSSVPTNFNLGHAPNNGTQEGLLLIKDFTNGGAGGTSVYNAFFSKIFAQTAIGNVTINHFGVNSVFNTTAGTTLSRGFYYNATSTSSVGLSHIAFENVVGNNYFNSSSGSTLIGYGSGIASSYKLDVKGTIRGTAQSTTDSHVFTTNQAGGDLTFFDIQQSVGTSSFKVSSSGYVTISNVTLVGNTTFNGKLTGNSTAGIAIIPGGVPSTLYDSQIMILVSAPFNDYTSTYGLNETGIFLGGTYNGGQGPQRLVLGPGAYYNSAGVATNVWNFTITPPSGQVTDGYGSSLILAGGRGRGAGTGGDLIFQTSTALTTGTTLQTLTSRWYIKYNTGTLSNVASPSASAALQIDSTTQGFLPPRMTGTNAAAIASKVAGLIVYVTDTTGGFSLSGWYGYDGTAWKKLDN